MTTTFRLPAGDQETDTSARTGHISPSLLAGDRMSPEEFHRRYRASPGSPFELVDGVVWPRGMHACGLEAGDRVSRQRFAEACERITDGTRFELIGGIAFMAAALYWPHSRIHLLLATVLGLYQAATPGVEAGDNATTRLSDDTEVQPDLLMRLLPAYGGQCLVELDDNGNETVVVGAPELVVEIAYSSRSFDLHLKRDAYTRAGVREYVVAVVEDRELKAWDPVAGKALPVGPDGIWRSQCFPGLWLKPEAVFRVDTALAVDVARQGIVSAEHAALVARMEREHGRPTE